MDSMICLCSFIILFIFPSLSLIEAQASLCRSSCGDIPINYPFGIDDGCGNPYYRHMLACSDPGKLELRTPSGRYPVRSISYFNPHILVIDPFMWNCRDGDNFRPVRPFSLDTGTHLSLSPENDYLFFNCSKDHVIVEPKPIFCQRFPELRGSSCDSGSYLCKHLPECATALGGSSFCSYYPKAAKSLRLMLKYCASYTSVYWTTVGATAGSPYNQCQDPSMGAGTCGFDTKTGNFLCLCKKGNVTSYCKGTVTAVSAAGAIGIGVSIWLLKKVRAKAPVTCGVQSNENRLF
ncbi:hypothetical protein V6Z11_A06G178000 [Gossypium hirsutum]